MIEGQDILTKAARLTYGMIGGGKGAFIGDVHRKAIAMDGTAELAAGCLSQTPAVTRETGEAWGIPNDRLYADYREMIAAEAIRPDRVDFILVVTPNDSHYAIARLALERGFHVVCDKPLATSSLGEKNKDDEDTSAQSENGPGSSNVESKPEEETANDSKSSESSAVAPDEKKPQDEGQVAKQGTNKKVARRPVKGKVSKKAN